MKRKIANWVRSKPVLAIGILLLALVLVFALGRLVVYLRGLTQQTSGTTPSPNATIVDTPEPATSAPDVRATGTPLPAALSSGSAVISGTYAGTIAIVRPVAMGVFDLEFTISEVDGTLTGAVKAEGLSKLAFPDAPTLQGYLTSTADSITTTFRIDSAVFGEEVEVSGFQVQRRFAIVGGALDGGQVLQGKYTEEITGFTPDPLTVEGLFLVARLPLASETVATKP